MKKNKNRKTKAIAVATLLVLILSLSGARAQEGVNAAGGNATGGSGTKSYSIGQVIYQTHIGAGGSVAEGAQQPYEISVVTNIHGADGIKLLVLSYPNPTRDFLTLEVKEFDLSGLFYQLIDFNGKLIYGDHITDTHTSIDMSSLMPAVYFVRIIQDKKLVKIIKVIKN
ncbi:MAG: T9SS type A sorting domain-containing protein [Bacteroidales bacterium]|nr:T9SS type A sorting domain-containing protein [Bacteroidales bacterium]